MFNIPTYCISLKDSPRRSSVKEEFKKVGIPFTFFDAINKHDLTVPELSPKLKIDKDISNGILACMMSHVQLIKKAKEEKLPAICIFEDDIIFCDDFNDRINYIEENVDSNWDIITLGGHFQKPDHQMIPNDNDASKVDNYLYKIKHQGGTYGYIIKDTVYDFIIRNCSYHYGMDEFYSDHVYERFNCYAFVPFLIGCKIGVSEITGSNHFYSNINWFYQQEKIGLKGRELIDLSDCTFITAVKIESPDREFNFLRVIQYLCDNFVTTIVIKEADTQERVVELLKKINKRECKIICKFEQSSVFHRTRLLNEALVNVKTPVTVNWDIDCLMQPMSFVLARNKVVEEGYDLVYPFMKGAEVQQQITVPQYIKNNYQGENLFNPDWCMPWQSYAGHAQFFKTDSYIDGGMENEEFISYGPEDRERCERFQRLGYKVCWMDDKIYHLEHSRGTDSSVSNPHFGHNDSLMDKFRLMSDEELKEYYKNVEYLKKYI